MVLIITAVGLLFGFGALMLFRFQCQLRIDRQHELEKVYAVRSAINFVSPFAVQISEAGWPFVYHTESERDLNVIVKPVEPIFPSLTNDSHLVMTSNSSSRNFQLPCGNQCSEFPEYEYGSSTNCTMNNFWELEKVYGLAFSDVENTNNATWWVNIGMRGTGGWLQEDYGRRYFFNLKDYIGSANSTKEMDIVRFCLIRNVTNAVRRSGCRHGWPLSHNGNEREWALVLQVGPRVMNNVNVTLSEWECGGGVTNVFPLLSRDDFENPNLVPSIGYLGFQLAQNRVSLFYISTYETEEVKFNPYSSAYIFSSVTNLSTAAYEHFSKYYNVNEKRWKIYDDKDRENGIFAPELRAVFEVQATSDLRPLDSGSNKRNFLTEFKVTPAYQYDIFVEHPKSVTNRATVVQKIASQSGGTLTAMTYDTHGTENKGFRKDEREAERKKNRR